MIDKLDHPWLKHPRIWITGGVLCLVVSVITWIAGRDPPTIIGEQLVTPSVEAGQEVVVHVPVIRLSDRACSVDISRDLYNSNHERSNIIEHQHVTAEGRAMRAVENASQLSLRIRIPANTPSGPAKIITDNSYRCTWNPSTWFWPIDDSWEASINVLPPSHVLVLPASQ